MVKNWIIILVFYSAFLLNVALGGEGDGKDDRFAREPTVSRAEVEILEQAVALVDQDREAAIELLRENTDDDSSGALDFALGTFYFQNNAAVEAEASYRRALKKFPAFDRARSNLARILIKQDRIDDALSELKEILLAGTARPSTLTMIGYTSLLKEEPVPAETAYRQALLLDPEDRNAYIGLVKSLLMQERYRETVSLLENLLKDDPSRSEFWFLLANARLALEEPDRAIVALECARRLKVASDESLATLADLYLNGGQLEEALARYKEAFAGQQPSLNRMLRASKAFILVRDPVRAAVLLEKIHAAAEGEVVELTPDQLHELNRLEARRAHLEGDLDTAARAYQRLIEDDPLDGDILLVLGDLYREKGELEEAMVSYEQASRIPDSKLNALIRRAQLEVERERYGKAVEFLEKAQVVKPQPHVARYLTQVRHLVR